MLALQLHRRKLRLVRDDSGAEKLDCATTTTTAANAVVWRALRASLHGRAGAAYESAMASAIAYEDWRVNVWPLPSCASNQAGGSPGDIANLKEEDVDWESRNWRGAQFSQRPVFLRRVV